jgi:hypothetical protein
VCPLCRRAVWRPPSTEMEATSPWRIISPFTRTAFCFVLAAKLVRRAASHGLIDSAPFRCNPRIRALQFVSPATVVTKITRALILLSSLTGDIAVLFLSQYSSTSNNSDICLQSMS